MLRRTAWRLPPKLLGEASAEAACGSVNEQPHIGGERMAFPAEGIAPDNMNSSARPLVQHYVERKPAGPVKDRAHKAAALPDPDAASR